MLFKVRFKLMYLCKPYPSLNQKSNYFLSVFEKYFPLHYCFNCAILKIFRILKIYYIIFIELKIDIFEYSIHFFLALSTICLKLCLNIFLVALTLAIY